MDDGAAIELWGWNSAAEIWVPIQVDVNGRVVVTT